MKICSKCKNLLGAEFFYKHSASKDGLFWICKKCAKERAAEFYILNKEKIVLKAKEWRSKNPLNVRRSTSNLSEENKESRRESVRKWRRNNKIKSCLMAMDWQKRNPEKKKEHYKKWRDKNQHLMNELSAERRSCCKQATPKWANKFYMQEIYHLARLRTSITRVIWHVDHIIPLNNKLVCGLHVETNMQVIPWIDNIRKSNKF